MDSNTLSGVMEVDLTSVISDASDFNSVIIINQNNADDLTQVLTRNYDENVSQWLETVDSLSPIDDENAADDNIATGPHTDEESMMDEAAAFALEPLASAVYNEEDDCPICKEPFEDQPITVLVCGHQFCSQCKEEWFKERENCPVCRAGPDGTPQQPDDEDENPYDTNDGNYSDDPYGNDSFGDCRSCGYPGYNAPRWSDMREYSLNRIYVSGEQQDEQSSMLDYDEEPIALPWYDTQSEWRTDGHNNNNDEDVPILNLMIIAENDYDRRRESELLVNQPVMPTEAGDAWFNMLMSAL